MVRNLLPGAMIIEVIVGFGLAMVGLTAILQLSNRSVNTSGAAVRQSRASGLADEGIDWIKEQSTALGWSGFLAKADADGEVYCLDQLVWNSGECEAAEIVPGTDFYRTVDLGLMTSGGKTLVNAGVIVTWDDGGRRPEVIRQYQFVPF